MYWFKVIIGLFFFVSKLCAFDQKQIESAIKNIYTLENVNPGLKNTWQDTVKNLEVLAIDKNEQMQTKETLVLLQSIQQCFTHKINNKIVVTSKLLNGEVDIQAVLDYLDESVIKFNMSLLNGMSGAITANAAWIKEVDTKLHAQVLFLLEKTEELKNNSFIAVEQLKNKSLADVIALLDKEKKDLFSMINQKSEETMGYLNQKEENVKRIISVFCQAIPHFFLGVFSVYCCIHEYKKFTSYHEEEIKKEHKYYKFFRILVSLGAASYLLYLPFHFKNILSNK